MKKVQLQLQNIAIFLLNHCFLYSAGVPNLGAMEQFENFDRIWKDDTERGGEYHTLVGGHTVEKVGKQ